jgi:hypothetical protein
VSNQNSSEVSEHFARYNGEDGLSALESSLGLASIGDENARVEALATEIGRRVTKWERSAARELTLEHETISKLFTVTERVGVSSYVNGGRLPGFWWAKLAVALNREVMYDRLVNQIHRETAALMASESAIGMRDSAGGAKIVGPNTESELLSAARHAAAEVTVAIDDMERLDHAGLMSNSEKLLAWHEALVESFTLSAPAGLPHEAQVIAYKEWMRSRFNGFHEEWEEILHAIPNNGFRRLTELVNRVNQGLVAAQYLSESATASAKARWDRLEPVKQWAFEQRAANPGKSRPAVIRDIAEEVKMRAKAAGESLSGDREAVIATITRWFRKAKIR